MANPDHYFKLVKQPLLLRHRAPLAGAGDGIAVNAQVSPVGVGSGVYPQITAQPIPGLMAELEVNFGWCDLSHRSRRPNDAGRERAQPLGLAADARWAWHEFCHVLMFANLGELEFPFATAPATRWRRSSPTPMQSRCATLPNASSRSRGCSRRAATTAAS